jgi:hypothetical protein
MCEPMGRREIFLTFSLLVEIEGHFINEFVSYVYETEDRSDPGTGNPRTMVLRILHDDFGPDSDSFKSSGTKSGSYPMKML